MLTVIEIESNEWSFSDSEYKPEIEEQLDIALDMWRSGNFAEAEISLKAIILVKPYHIDAIHHLGLLFDDTGRQFEAYLCAKEASQIGIDALPKTFSWHTARISWGDLSNRPFMRAYHALGLFYLKRHEHGKAQEALRRLVSVHPNDNLGARYDLLCSYATISDWKSVLALSAEYSEDCSPDFLYTKAVALFERGLEAEGHCTLEKAVSTFPLVAKEILKKRHIRPKSLLSGTMTVGGEDQAYNYWENNKNMWGKDSLAIKFLKQIVNG